MGFLEKFGRFFKEKIWAKGVIRLLFFGLIIFLGYSGIKSCFSKHEGINKVYRIARDPSWPGIILRGKESNLLGFVDSLIDTITRNQHIRIESINVPARSFLEGLQDENFDAVVTQLSPDLNIRDKYLFSDPFYSLGVILVVDAQSPAKSIEDLSGKTIGFLRGTSLLMQGRVPSKISLVPYESMTIAIDELMRDRIDGVVMDLFSAYAMQDGFYKGKIKVLPPPLTDEALRLVSTHENHSEYLIENFNKGLTELKADGTYQEMLKRFDLINYNQ